MAMEDRNIEGEGLAEKASNRRLNAIHKDLQDQVLELRAELRSFRLTVYGSLLAGLVALLAADGQWGALAVLAACVVAYSAQRWARIKVERAGRDTP
jgi:hypothetical protein